MANKKLFKQLSTVVGLAKELASRPALAVLYGRHLLSACNSIHGLFEQIGIGGEHIPQAQHQELAKLLRQLPLPQLMAKVLSTRGITMPDAQLTDYVSALDTVLKSCCAVFQICLRMEDQRARRLVATGMATHILSCDVLEQLAQGMTAFTATLDSRFQASVPRFMALQMLHLWWWDMADEVLSTAGHSRLALLDCATAASGLIMTVARCLTVGSNTNGTVPVNHFVQVACELMRYPCPEEEEQHTGLQQLFTTPAFLQALVMLVVMHSRRVCAFAAKSQQQGGPTSCRSNSSSNASSSSSSGSGDGGSSSGSSSSRSSATAAVPAAAAVEAAPASAQSLLPLLQLHQEQLWNSLGLSVDALNVFDAAITEPASLEEAVLDFSDPVAQARSSLAAMTHQCLMGQERTSEQLQPLPLHLKQVLQSVMWDLPVVLLGTAACFLKADPTYNVPLVEPAGLLLVCWQLPGELTATAAAATSPEAAGAVAAASAAAAPCPSLPTTSVASAKQQDSPQKQQQQALAHLLQCWLVLMQQLVQQQLLQQQQQRQQDSAHAAVASLQQPTGPLQQAFEGESSDSNSCCMDDPSNNNEVAGKLMMRMLHNAALYGPQINAVWVTYAAQLSITLEQFLRAVLFPAIVSGGNAGQQEQLSAGNCWQKQQPAGNQQQQQQPTTANNSDNGSSSHSLEGVYKQFWVVGNTLQVLLCIKGSRTGPFLATALTDAAAHQLSNSRFPQLLSLLTSFAKVQWCVTGVCRSHFKAMEAVSGPAGCIVDTILKGPCSDSLAELQAAVAPWLVLQGRYLMLIGEHMQGLVSGGAGHEGHDGGSFSTARLQDSCSSREGDGSDGSSVIQLADYACEVIDLTVDRVSNALWLFDPSTTLDTLQQRQHQQQRQADQPPLLQQQQGNTPCTSHQSQETQQHHVAAVPACNTATATAGRNIKGVRILLNSLIGCVCNARVLTQAVKRAAQRFEGSTPSFGAEQREVSHGRPCTDNSHSTTTTTTTTTSSSSNSGDSSNSGSCSGGGNAVPGKLSEQDSAALQAARSPSECVSVLLLSSCMQALPQLLQDAGAALCAALPVPCMCNNPGCSNMACSSELLLVGGKGCVCGGCKVARYCSRACQAAQWKQHKPVCRYLAAQQHSGAEGEGGRGASSAAQT